ncbi:MAG: hypothetical protein WC841_02990 [Candidatus Shapirobacteria bacterium]|jgi:hypothetical protein
MLSGERGAEGPSSKENRPTGYWRSTIAYEGIPKVAADDMEERITKVTSFARQVVTRMALGIVDGIPGLGWSMTVMRTDGRGKEIRNSNSLIAGDGRASELYRSSLEGIQPGEESRVVLSLATGETVCLPRVRW